jgi:ABC-type bacteriocin/lantibiotic exporter with double-glycine peptidase domain
MIKDTILRLLVEHEEKTDGGLESFLTILKHYKGNTSSINLYEVMENNYPLTSIPSLVETASKCGFTSATYDNIDINTLTNYTYPLIIGTTSTDNKVHFVVCFNYSYKDGFLLWDSRKGLYKKSIEELKSLRADEKCVAFYPN